MSFATIPELVEDIRAGRMVVIVEQFGDGCKAHGQSFVACRRST